MGGKHPPEASPTMLVDAHVHFHACYAPSVFLNSALANFRKAAVNLGVGSGAYGVLAFTEALDADYFQRFRDGTGSWLPDGWRMRATAERTSVIAERDDGRALVLVAGRQITTREDVEVLALGSDRRIPSHRPLQETIGIVRDAGGIPVVPWGFGKWWFRRGAVVAELLGSNDMGLVFLGDNGGRWRRGPRPRLFALAASRGIGVLPGTDPLPFPGHATRPGRYGFLLEGQWNREEPASSLKRLLSRGLGQPTCYGEGEGLAAFGYWQVRMQLRKRLEKLRRRGP